ncbi:Nup133 N terminal like-domain-containing protein [Xylariomycetidae sp. FL2044]|nr:Nup133 N terminal like-domain-containing protein [Xylariomycetidae sp. FL2044]
MFSPSLSNGHAAASSALSTGTRGRRRQRPLSSDNSIQQPKAKRQRPTLSDDTFLNPLQPSENYEVKSARSSLGDPQQDGIQPSSTPKQELSVRSKKSRTADRHSKGDGSTLLSTNTAFDVRKLPALPDRLKLDATSRQHGYVDSSTGYALSLTHTHAIVWPYSTPTQSPESFTFTLPYPSKHSTDPLPLGALVSPSASSSEPGLVVVMPTSGKVTYWESISSATTLDFMRQQRNGVEGSVSGMFSGESVNEITNAESAAGFLLALSSGRMAYLNVRDGHGRPKISTQFLRTSLGPSSGGFLGSIRHALSHAALQGDIVAVRSNRLSAQSECIVVGATSKGRLHSWKVHRGGHHDLLAELDARSIILDAVQRADQMNAKMPPESLKVLDFSFVPQGLDSRQADMSQLRRLADPEGHQHILLLTSLSYKQTCRYNLVEVILPADASPENPAVIGMVRPISAYSTPPDARALAKPRLYLPNPAIIAFLVFDHAAVIASIAQQPESPEAQLMEDNHILPPYFEDIVDLRDDPALEIVGSGMEEPHGHGSGSDEGRPNRIKTKNPTAVLLVRGVGTLRITVTEVERFASEQPPKITAKSKLEQAVFFGVKDDNPLVFDVQHDMRFSEDEYGEAALELSQEILTSSGPHLSSLAARVETNIRERVRYMEKIMTHIESLQLNIRRATRWRLLWNAEKLHVASTLWRKHEEFTSLRPASTKKSIIAEIVEYIRSEQKTEPDVAKGEVDQLRHWFVRDVDRMEIFIAWAYEVIKHNTQAKADDASLVRLIYEASDMYNSAIRAAFAFRLQNLPRYGLESEKLEHGILAGGYAGLPVPWTCHPFIANSVKKHLFLTTNWIKERWTAESKPKDELIVKIRELLPEMTEVYLTVLQELSRSYVSSDDPKMASDGQKFEQEYDEHRHNKVVDLADSENWEAAIRIAETHRSLAALAQVLIREINNIRDQLHATVRSSDDHKRLTSRMDTKVDQVKEYFGSYGREFAFPFYEYLFTTFGIDALLEYDMDKKYKTIFLRTKPELAKVSWINDIINEEDIDHAANTLLNLGFVREQQVWNKKIELSLGKLARMAESSRPSSKASLSAQEIMVKGVAGDARVDAIDKELAIINIQNGFYETQIRPIISVALDESEEFGLVQERFLLSVPNKYKILNQIFEDGLRRLLKHEALDPLTLIDLLTLVTLPPETREQSADQFFLAIQVAYNGLTGSERELAERHIWKRCYLREDWNQVNNTSLRNDNDILDTLGQTDLFQFYCTLYANEQKEGDGVNYKRLRPSDAAGVYTETLDRRFEKMEKNYREKVLEAMRWEDTNLRKYIEKYRLEQWAKETRRFAEDAVNAQFDESTAAGAVVSPTKSPSARKSSTGLNGAEDTNGQNGTH